MGTGGPGFHVLFIPAKAGNQWPAEHPKQYEGPVPCLKFARKNPVLDFAYPGGSFYFVPADPSVIGKFVSQKICILRPKNTCGPARSPVPEIYRTKSGL